MRGRLRGISDPSADVNNGKEIPDYGGNKILYSLKSYKLYVNIYIAFCITRFLDCLCLIVNNYGM